MPNAEDIFENKLAEGSKTFHDPEVDLPLRSAYNSQINRSG